MKHSGGEIFIGDLVRAIAATHTDDPQLTGTIARLLGFQLKQPEVQFEAQQSTQPSEFTLPPGPPQQVIPENKKAEQPEPSAPPTPEEDLEYDVNEPDIEHIPPAKTAGLQTATSLPEWERVTKTSLTYRPLFLSQWTRGLLSEAAATWRASGPVDIPRALEILVRSTTAAELPLRYTQTLVRGCHVMVDISAGMAPFAHDCWRLVEAMRSVVGREQVQVFYFKDCPVYGVETEAEARSIPFQPPPATTPVLLLSDLGIAEPPFSFRRAAIQDWLRLAHRLREAKCPLLALVPYPRSRWPEGLGKELTILQWDRVTTAATVRRAKETP